MTSSSAETVLVLNPRSGSGDHTEAVRHRADLLGYSIEKTEHENHAIELAKDAALGGADEIVAVGGDGTLNEVVCGVDAADALDRVTVGVAPAGTGNDFAEHIGITSLDDGFQAVEDGERRGLDLGMAGERPFLNSCLAGITAKASKQTSSELKSRLGVLAYVVTALQVTSEFSGLDLRASVVEGTDSETVWEGSAAMVLVGNGRRFSMSGVEQANLEDGLLDIAIIENATSLDLVEDRLIERLFHRESDHLHRILASSLELDVGGDTKATFSLDGEIIEETSLTVTTRRKALEMPVGDGYERHPKVE